MSQEKSSDYQAQLDINRKIWDDEAETFDNEADHGLGLAHVRQAWKNLLANTLPDKSNASVLDVGCGTGSLSILLAEAGYTVTACDFSPEMIARAREKAIKANQAIQFHIMDAAFPEFNRQQFDVILCRHLLWALADPEKVLERWIHLLKPGGNLLLVEGFWHTGGGLHTKEILSMMPARMTDISLQNLSENDDLWGKSVTDERYLIGARLNG